MDYPKDDFVKEDTSVKPIKAWRINTGGDLPWYTVITLVEIEGKKYLINSAGGLTPFE